MVLGFPLVVLGFPLMLFRQIIEMEFQKCEAQPAFLPGFVWEPPGDFVVGLHGSGVGLRVFSANPGEGVSKVWSRPPETAERRRRDRLVGRARATGTIEHTRIFLAWLRQVKVDGKNPQGLGIDNYSIENTPLR